MPQLLFSPQAIYKYFRNLVIGHDGTGSETDDFYISKNIGVPATQPIKQLAYFKVGVGGPASAELTRTFFDANCKNIPSAANTLGDLNTPIHIYPGATGYGGSRDKKALVAGNFYNYGSSQDSKVIGTLSVVTDSENKYWNIPGIAFQVACHLTAAEGNYDSAGNLVTAPDVVNINEIGVFDEDDVMVLYGVFTDRPKNNTLSLKANCVAMLKVLDYQLVDESLTSTTSSSSSTLSTSSSTSSTLSTLSTSSSSTSSSSSSTSSSSSSSSSSTSSSSTSSSSSSTVSSSSSSSSTLP